MISNNFLEILRLLKYCYGMFPRLRLWMVSFVCLSVMSAMTEGFGISLLIPLLDMAGASNMVDSHNKLLSPMMSWSLDIPLTARVSLIANVLFVILCLRGILMYASQVLAELMPLQVQAELMKGAYANLLYMQVGYINRLSVGSIIDAIAQIPVRISNLVLQISSSIFNSLLVLGYSILMVAVSWRMTLAAGIFFLVITYFLKKVLNSRLINAGVFYTEASARSSTILHETVNGLRLIRLSVGEPAMAYNFNRNTDDLIAAKRQISLLRSITSPLLTTTTGAFICALLVSDEIFGGNGVTTASWITTIIVFNALVLRLLTPVSSLNASRHYIAGDLNAFHEFERLSDLLQTNRQPTGKLEILAIQRELSFENVFFSYPGSSQAALSNFNLSIHKGEMIALVGPSGAGKSTVAGLVARLLDPSRGLITVDGIDLRELNVSTWHRLIGVVSQEAFIFNDTVSNNLRFAKPNASEQELMIALQRASALDMVSQMQDGLDSMLGERGGRLSGGQIQRLALARVLLADPQLIILDEATSNLDTISEAAIHQSIETLRGSCTIIAIAHRLSTVARADRIVVMDNGKIDDVGTHSELLEKSSLYKNLLKNDEYPLSAEPKTNDYSSFNSLDSYK